MIYYHLTASRPQWIFYCHYYYNTAARVIFIIFLPLFILSFNGIQTRPQWIFFSLIFFIDLIITTQQPEPGGRSDRSDYGVGCNAHRRPFESQAASLSGQATVQTARPPTPNRVCEKRRAPQQRTLVPELQAFGLTPGYSAIRKKKLGTLVIVP